MKKQANSTPNPSRSDGYATAATAHAIAEKTSHKPDAFITLCRRAARALMLPNRYGSALGSVRVAYLN